MRRAGLNLWTLSTALIASGVLIVLWRPSWAGLVLVIAGCAVRPLSKLRLIRNPLDNTRLRRLPDEALDLFESVAEHLRLRKSAEAEAKDLRKELTAQGFSEVTSTLKALLDCGLLELRQRKPPQPEPSFSGYALGAGAQVAVDAERERRLRSPRPGKRSRPSMFAERLERASA